MFGIAPSELMIVAIAAIVLIGPKDLPRVMRLVGLWVGRGRAMVRNVHNVVDDIIREAELQDIAEKMRAQSELVTREPTEASKRVLDPSVERDAPNDERRVDIPISSRALVQG